MWSLLSGPIKAILDWLQKRSDDTPREQRLRELLANKADGKEWVTMKLLSESIGADEKETARLLLKIGARRSTGVNNVWAFTSDKPL